MGEKVRTARVFTPGGFPTVTYVSLKENELEQKIGTLVPVTIKNNQKSLWQNLKRAGEFNWKILHRFPWLRPFAPFYQMFRYTRQVLTTKGALKSMLHGSGKAKKEQVFWNAGESVDYGS